MKTDPEHIKQIIHLHYMPGLRLAYQELGELIQSLEATQPTERPAPEPGIPRSPKGVAYNGTHWTQTPEGKVKLKAVIRKRWDKLYAEHGRGNLTKGGKLKTAVPSGTPSANVQRGTLDARGHRKPAVHWTQTREGREKMRLAQQRAVAAR